MTARTSVARDLMQTQLSNWMCPEIDYHTPPTNCKICSKLVNAYDLQVDTYRNMYCVTLLRYCSKHILTRNFAKQTIFQRKVEHLQNDNFSGTGISTSVGTLGMVIVSWMRAAFYCESTVAAIHFFPLKWISRNQIRVSYISMDWRFVLFGRQNWYDCSN